MHTKKSALLRGAPTVLVITCIVITLLCLASYLQTKQKQARQARLSTVLGKVSISFNASRPTSEVTQYRCVEFLSGEPATLGSFGAYTIKAPGTITKPTLFYFYSEGKITFYDGLLEYQIIGDMTKRTAEVLGKQILSKATALPTWVKITAAPKENYSVYSTDYADVAIEFYHCSMPQ